MPRYEPDALPHPTELTQERLAEYLQNELRKIAGTVGVMDEGMADPLSVAPGKPRTGQLVYADGVTWNPGYGAGYYFWNGYAWVPAFGAAATKNRIIAGDFTTAPWLLGTPYVAIPTGAYASDTFRVDFVTSAVVTASQSANAPTVAQAGYHTQHSLLIDCTTADAAVAAGDFFTISQRIEGLHAASLGFGQAGERYVTLAFWVRATKTGTYCASLRNSAQNRSYVKEYVVNTADTWELKILTFPVDTTGTWLYTNGIGVIVSWALMGGTTFQTAANAWAAGDFVATTNQVNALDNTANNFRLALVSLEPGTQFTGFEWLPEPSVLSQVNRHLCIVASAFRSYTGDGYNGVDFQYPQVMRGVPTARFVAQGPVNNFVNVPAGAGFFGITVYGAGYQYSIQAAGTYYDYGAIAVFDARL